MLVLKLSVSEVIITQKGSNGDGKLHFFGRGYVLLALFAQKIHLWPKVTKGQSVRVIKCYFER